MVNEPLYYVINDKKNKHSQIPVFFAMLAFVMLFITESREKSNGGVQIPFIKVNSIYLWLSVVLVSGIAIIISTIVNKKFSFNVDLICLLLLARVIFCVIQLFYLDLPDTVFGNLATISLPFAVYFIFKNIKFSSTAVINILMAFAVIVCAQCVLAYGAILNLGRTYGNAAYKHFFILPVGASNYIACILLPILILGDNLISNKSKFIFLPLMCLGVFLTKSRGGVLFVCLYYAYRVCKLIVCNKKLKHYYKIAILIGLAGIVIGVYFIPLIRDKVNTFIKGFSATNPSGDITSGRINLLKKYWVVIKENLWLGSGICYENMDAMRPHNVIFQVLYENGLVGLVWFVFLVVVIVKKILNMTDLRLRKAVILMFIFSFLNSMIEDCMLTLHVDFIFVTMLAIIDKNEKKARVCFLK